MSSVVAFAYFRGWLRCVKWKAWSYIGRGLVRIMAVVCKSVNMVSCRIFDMS